MNKKKLRLTYIRVLKFALIGAIPAIFASVFLEGKTNSTLISFIDILLMLGFAVVGEIIYTNIKNKQILQALAKTNSETEQKQKEKGGK